MLETLWGGRWPRDIELWDNAFQFGRVIGKVDEIASLDARCVVIRFRKGELLNVDEAESVAAFMLANDYLYRLGHVHRGR